MAGLNKPGMAEEKMKRGTREEEVHRMDEREHKHEDMKQQ